MAFSARAHTSVDDVRKELDAGYSGTYNSEFIEACAQGKLELVQFFLALGGQHRVNINTRRRAAYRRACRNGHVAVVRELLRAEGGTRLGHSDTRNRAFAAACTHNRADVVRELLAIPQGRHYVRPFANCWATTPRPVFATWGGAFGVACLWDCVDVVRLLLEVQDERRVNTAAVQRACRDIITVESGGLQALGVLAALRDNRAPRTYHGLFHWLRIACHDGHAEVVRRILHVYSHASNITPVTSDEFDSCVRDTSCTCCRNTAVPHALRELLAHEGFDAYRTEDHQNSHYEAYMRATEAWTDTLAAWRACPLTRRPAAVRGFVQHSVHRNARRTVWKARRRVTAAWRHASS